MKFSIALIASLCVAAVAAFDPLTLTIGSTAYVLTGTQVAVAVASVSALALAKEALLLNELSRGKRSTDENEAAGEVTALESLWDAVEAVDVAGCGKLIVCHVLAKPEESLSAEERRVTKLFEDVEHKINPASGYAEYQLAALTGTYKKPELCAGRYNRCPFKADQLTSFLKV